MGVQKFMSMTRKPGIQLVMPIWQMDIAEGEPIKMGKYSEKFEDVALSFVALLYQASMVKKWIRILNVIINIKP